MRKYLWAGHVAQLADSRMAKIAIDEHCTGSVRVASYVSGHSLDSGRPHGLIRRGTHRHRCGVPLNRWDTWLTSWSSAALDSGNLLFWKTLALDADKWKQGAQGFAEYICYKYHIGGKTSHVAFDLNVLNRSLQPERFRYWSALAES
jgi:hypothetical protein